MPQMRGMYKTQAGALAFAKQLLDDGLVVGIAFELTDGLWHVSGERPVRVHKDLPLAGYPTPAGELKRHGLS